MYIWQGQKENTSTVYLYVGIVGDTKTEGRSKRHLTQRLKEEEKKFKKENNVDIKQLRYCSINNAPRYSIPELLKTVEISEITVMTSLFRCENARDNIDGNIKKIIGSVWRKEKFTLNDNLIKDKKYLLKVYFEIYK